MIRLIFSTVFLLICFTIQGQQKFTVNGYVRDATNGETLIGATVYIRTLETGAVTNEYGFYAITVPSGNYEMLVS